MRFQNPILSGFHPDPSICRVGDRDYYLVTSTFDYFPGIPIFHSRDLVNWRRIGHVLDRASQLPPGLAGPSEGVFAPTLRYDNGIFYLINTYVGAGGNFVVTATDPAGPWSDPHWLPDAEGIDSSLFFDDDGRCWYVGNGAPDEPLYDGHQTIWQQQFDPATLSLIGPKRVIVEGGTDIKKQPIWIEGPHLYKIGSWYYLLAAEGGTAEDHSVVIFRSRDVTGPYESYSGNPILTNRDLDPSRPNPITCTGHADLVQTRTGEWWMALLACRPYPPGEQGDYNTGRETFLAPITWTADGWPVTADGTGHLAASYTAPDLPPHPWLDGYPMGAFTWRDEFDSARLRQDWNTIGPPAGGWCSLTARPGFLRLSPRLGQSALTGANQPCFIGVRQRHIAFAAETTLEFQPSGDSDAAGLVVMQNRRGYYALECARSGSEIVLRLVKQSPEEGSPPEIRAEAPLPEGQVRLRVEASGRDYVFSFASEEGAWRQIGAVEDGTILSTRRCGGFVGAYVGLYATTRSAAALPGGVADFDDFTYSGRG